MTPYAKEQQRIREEMRLQVDAAAKKEREEGYKRMKPHHTHDCAYCKFLGTIMRGEERNDAWVCTGGDPSIILRYGSDGPEYWSCPSSMVKGMGQPTSMWSAAEPKTYFVLDTHILALWAYQQAVERGFVEGGTKPRSVTTVGELMGDAYYYNDPNG